MLIHLSHELVMNRDIRFVVDLFLDLVSVFQLIFSMPQNFMDRQHFLSSCPCRLDRHAFRVAHIWILEDSISIPYLGRLYWKGCRLTLATSSEGLATTLLLHSGPAGISPVSHSLP